MNWPTRDRWAALWRAAGTADISIGWYERLEKAYAEPQRHYHTQQHIGECLAQFDEARHLARQPVAVEFAIWFHDAVYDPKAADNEEQSAALAKACVAETGVNSTLIRRVADLIMVTKSHAPGEDADDDLMIDVDLSIFGQPRRRFDEYEDQIRLEYSWVPDAIFKSKRAEILQRFLQRENIFRTAWFRSRYEAQARQNLVNSIARLNKP